MGELLHAIATEADIGVVYVVLVGFILGFMVRGMVGPHKD
jgi:hypothetical protein